MESNTSEAASSQQASNGAVMSDREHEILRLVATGASNKQIAQQLFISPNTVKVHLRNIFGKIGVASRTEAALYAIRAGLVHVPAGTPLPMEENDRLQAEILAPEGPPPAESIETQSVVEQPTSIPRPLNRMVLSGLLVAVVALVV